MKFDEVTRAGRVTRLKSLQLFGSYLSGDERSAEGDCLVAVVTEDDVFGEKNDLFGFKSQEAAEEWMAQFKVGQEFSLGGEVLEGHAKLELQKNLELEAFIAGPGDSLYPECQEILHAAGLYTETFGRLSESVLDWFEPETLLEIQDRHGENYEVALVALYSRAHFHEHSRACRAAQVMYHYFITGNDMAVGYLYRDLQTLSSNVELLHVRNLKRAEKAKIAAGKKSAEKKKQRLDLLISELEKLRSVVGLMDEDKIFQQAYQNAQLIDESMPKTTSVVFEYGVALRSEEPFKTKYQEIFKTL